MIVFHASIPHSNCYVASKVRCLDLVASCMHKVLNQIAYSIGNDAINTGFLACKPKKHRAACKSAQSDQRLYCSLSDTYKYKSYTNSACKIF